MGVAEYQVGGNTLPGNDVLPGQPGQKPYFLSLLEGACRFIAHPFSQQGIRKGECLCILYDLVAVCDYTKDFPVCVPYVCFVAGNYIPGIRIDWLLQYLPVKPGHFKGFRRFRGFPYFCP